MNAVTPPTSPRTSRRPSVAVAAAVLLPLLVGCTPSPPTSGATPSASASPTSTATATPATAQGEGPFGPVDVTVRSLTRDPNGTTMTLRASFTARFTWGGFDSLTLSGMNNFTILTPVLLDRENLKRYHVLSGFGQDKLMNQDATAVRDEPLEMWFVFAAPEDDIDTIAMTIDEWMLEFPDIPIEDSP